MRAARLVALTRRARSADDDAELGLVIDALEIDRGRQLDRAVRIEERRRRLEEQERLRRDLVAELGRVRA